MRIAIIDADLIGRTKHRFPNLVCEKLSAYYKEMGGQVELKLNYNNLDDYDKVFISKVFTDTPIPEWLHETDKIHMGGTGFYFDKAPKLPEEIEHHMPDYHLYDEWITSQITADQSKNQYAYYTDYSIGFMTRGCFRKCPFCVNQHYDRVSRHSSLEEFYDPTRKKICLLDDNMLGCPEWRNILEELIALGKPFQFKQGLDERLLTDDKVRMLFNTKYDGDYIFAFDNISDYDLVHSKLKLIRKYTDVTNIKFYVLVDFESTDARDIDDMWKRIALLMQYKCVPYIMRYQNKNDKPYMKSKYKGLYINIAKWCNQPGMFKKMSFREFCKANQDRIKTAGKICSPMQSLIDFEAEHPDIARKYFDLKYGMKGELQMSSVKQIAEILDGICYGVEDAKINALQLPEDIVVVFGYSDDNAEFRGAIDDEIGCFNGGFLRFMKDGFHWDDSAGEYVGCNIIEAVWCEEYTEDGKMIPWIYKTDILHETFMIYEDGEPFCRGIVFSVNDLK